MWLTEAEKDINEPQIAGEAIDEVYELNNVGIRELKDSRKTKEETVAVWKESCDGKEDKWKEAVETHVVHSCSYMSGECK